MFILKFLILIVILLGLGCIVFGLVFFLFKVCLMDFSFFLIVDVFLVIVVVDCWFFKIIWYISLEKKKVL